MRDELQNEPQSNIFSEFPVAVSFLKEAGFSDEFLQTKFPLCLSEDREHICLSTDCSYISLGKDTFFVNNTFLEAFYHEDNSNSTYFCYCYACEEKLGEYAERQFDLSKFADYNVIVYVRDFIHKSVELMVIEKLLKTNFTSPDFSLHRFAYVVSDILETYAWKKIRENYPINGLANAAYEKHSQGLLGPLGDLSVKVEQFSASKEYLAALQKDVKNAVSKLSAKNSFPAGKFTDFYGKFAALKLPLSRLIDVAELMDYEKYYNFSSDLGFFYDELFQNIAHVCSISQVMDGPEPFALWHVPGEFIEFVALHAPEGFLELDYVVLEKPWSFDEIKLAECFLDSSRYASSSIFENLAALCTAVSLA